jgi:hypothetical protein
MALVSFRGPLGAGKTHAANLCVEKLGFVKVAFADPLRLEIYSALDAGYFKFPTGTPQEVVDSFSAELTAFPKNPDEAAMIEFITKNKKVLRPLMQWWGTEYRRGEDENYWTDKFTKKVKPILMAGGRVAVDDLRFENEMKLLKRLGGYDVLVNAPEEHIRQRIKARDGKVAKGLAAHASEQELPFIPDYTISNDGSLEVFEMNVNFVMNKILSNPKPSPKRVKKQI